MDSKIICKEIVLNKDRKFGASLFYYPCIVTNEQGERAGALFTQDEINKALIRAERNPEDIEEDVTMWDYIFKGKKATLNPEARVDYTRNIELPDIDDDIVKEST